MRSWVANAEQHTPLVPGAEEAKCFGGNFSVHRVRTASDPDLLRTVHPRLPQGPRVSRIASDDWHTVRHGGDLSLADDDDGARLCEEPSNDRFPRAAVPAYDVVVTRPDDAPTSVPRQDEERRGRLPR